MAVAAEEKLTPNDAADLVGELLPAPISSRELGLKLGLSKPVVEHIHRTFSEPQDRLFHVLIESTSASGSRPTWKAFGEALRSPEVDVPDLAEEIISAFTTSKPDLSAEEKLTSSTTLDEEVKSKPTLVDSLKGRVKGLRQRFRSIRKSTIQCLEKCQVAVVTVVSLVTTILGFNVREVVRGRHKKDLTECRDHWELFGYLNLYWNYLSFNLLKELLDEHALKDCSHAKNEIVVYMEEVERLRQDTSLLLYCRAVCHTGFAPPGFQTMVTEHEFTETATLQSLEDFRMGFLEIFGLPDCAMMLDGVKMGSVKVIWFTHLQATVIQLLKGSQGRIKTFRDFKVTSVEIDKESIFRVQDSVQESLLTTHSMATTEATATKERETSPMLKPTQEPTTHMHDITEGDPRITESDMFFCIRRRRMRGYIDSHVLDEQFMSHNVYCNVFHRLPHRIDFRNELMIQDLFEELGDIHNGFQIFYHCLRETQDIPGHRILADDLEERARMRLLVQNLGVGSFPTTIKSDYKCDPVDLDYNGDSFSYASTTGIGIYFPAGECERPVNISVEVVNDDYILPSRCDEMPIVSDMYKITTSDKLPVPVTICMNHCAVMEEDDSLVFIIAHGSPPYQFNLLYGGIFPADKTYGEIELKNFSILAILAHKLGWRMSLSVQVFYQRNNTATFVATKNTRSLIQAVKNTYADATFVSCKSILCDYTTKVITLSIPAKPQAGWAVVPDFDPPQILTRLIREYREGKTPPCIQLKLKWTGPGKPKEEELKIGVQGCSIESFTLFCKPSSVATLLQSQPSPEQQSLGLQSTAGFPSPLSSVSSNAPSVPHTPRESHAPLEQPQPRASMALTTSVESRTLRRSNTIFTSGVDPDNIVKVLYSNFLLTPEEKARATQQTLTVHQKLEEIFQTMERRISVTPGDLHVLIKALKAEPATKAVGDKMQEIYDEECGKRQE